METVAGLAVRPGLDSPAYVASMKRQWGDTPPEKLTVVEFHGTGDLFFGGGADDRVLAVDGQIAGAGCQAVAATFTSIDEAHAAAMRIRNRRAGSVLGVVPQWPH
jgi:hypothetical protein